MVPSCCIDFINAAKHPLRACMAHLPVEHLRWGGDHWTLPIERRLNVVVTRASFDAHEPGRVAKTTIRPTVATTSHVNNRNYFMIRFGDGTPAHCAAVEEWLTISCPDEVARRIARKHCCPRPVLDAEQQFVKVLEGLYENRKPHTNNLDGLGTRTRVEHSFLMNNPCAVHCKPPSTGGSCTVASIVKHFKRSGPRPTTRPMPWPASRVSPGGTASSCGTSLQVPRCQAAVA
jgi:hypothetical protein